MDSNADEQVASSESDEDEDLDAVEEPRYQIGQKIFARDGKSGIYESVVKKVESRPGVAGWSYWVHYLGWNSRWDRWIPQDGLLDDTDVNRALSQKASEEQRQISSTKKRKREEKEQNRLEKKRQKKKDTSLVMASKKISRNILSLEDYCQIPFTLKTIMLDDRSALSSESDHLISEDDLPWQPNRLVHNLPAAVTIQMVLDKFVKRTKKEAAAKVKITPNMKSTKQKTETESDQEDEEARMAAARRIVKTAEKDAQESVEILANLFNEALPVLLLYHEERYQHLAIVNETMRDHKPVEFYGCEHFLRLFVRLPILWNAALGDSTIEVQQFGEQIASLLVFLQKHHNSCFRAQYRPPTRNEMTPSEKATQDNLNEPGS